MNSSYISTASKTNTIKDINNNNNKNNHSNIKPVFKNNIVRNPNASKVNKPKINTALSKNPDDFF